MKCESKRCNNPADWTRPQVIQGCSNNLCNACFVRIYSGFGSHTSTWFKITETPSPIPPPPIANQTELF